MSARAIKRAGAAVAGVVVLLPALAGCGSSGGNTSSAATQSGTNTLPQSSEPSNLNPAEFTPNVDNPYWPMPVGRVWHVHVTNPQGESLQETITVENRTKKIADGVTARVVNDVVYDHGRPKEITDDWYAQDSEGNIWYFGENTAEVRPDGTKDTSGSFEAGKNGADAGIAMAAHPEVGLTYREEYYKGHAEDRTRVLALDQQVEAPAGHFTGAILTDDYSPLEPTVSEYKLYAKGVGPVVAVSVSGENEREDLVGYSK
jgi:hypothetical protein